jgi:photosystem II stability/assembly factor-like uncharacterized protein
MSELGTTQLDAVNAFASSATHIYSAKASGLYQSDDAGQSWQLMTDEAQTYGSPVTSIAAVNDTLFAGLNGAILCTDDRGDSWRVIALSAPPPLVSSIVISPDYNNDGTVFAGTTEDGVFVSTNYGENWSPWNFGLIDLDIYCLALSPNFANDATIYAGTETGVFCSHNAGKSWHDIPFPMESAPVLSLSVTEDEMMFAGTDGNGLFVSDDNGHNWSRLLQSTELTVDTIHSTQVNTDHLVILADEHLIQIQLSDFTPTVLKSFTDQYALAFGQTDTNWIVGFVDGLIEII